MLTPHLQIILHKGPFLICNIHCSIFTTYLYVILHAGLARSCRIHISKNLTKTFSLGRRCPSGRMRGGGYRLSPLPSPIVCVGPSSPGGRGFFDGRMDSATSHSAPRRMTGWWELLGEWTFIILSDQPSKCLVLCVWLLGEAVWNGFRLMFWAF